LAVRLVLADEQVRATADEQPGDQVRLPVVGHGFNVDAFHCEGSGSSQASRATLRRLELLLLSLNEPVFQHTLKIPQFLKFPQEFHRYACFHRMLKVPIMVKNMGMGRSIPYHGCVLRPTPTPGCSAR
jgi:hypothetical protein